MKVHPKHIVSITAIAMLYLFLCHCGDGNTLFQATLVHAAKKCAAFYHGLKSVATISIIATRFFLPETAFSYLKLFGGFSFYVFWSVNVGVSQGIAPCICFEVFSLEMMG